MKQKFFALLTAAFLFAACGNDAATKNEGIDTVAAHDGDEDLLSPEAQMVQKAFPNMYMMLKGQDDRFDPALFQETEGGTTTPVPARFFPPEELEPFKPFLIYNEDSTRAIDLVSHNYVINKKNSVQMLEPAGPDTEVGIIDLKSGMRTRIFFSGPGTVIREGKWLDEHSVLLGGAEEVSSTSIKPILLRIDLKQNGLQRFTYADSLKAKI